VSDSIQFMAGRVNELWNVVGLAPPTFVHEPIPTQADNYTAGTIH
jgi:hypothetical protein